MLEEHPADERQRLANRNGVGLGASDKEAALSVAIAGRPKRVVRLNPAKKHEPSPKDGAGSGAAPRGLRGDLGDDGDRNAKGGAEAPGWLAELPC
jgi:hypothetical protein